MARVKKVKVAGTKGIYTIDYVGFHKGAINFHLLFKRLSEVDFQESPKKVIIHGNGEIKADK